MTEFPPIFSGLVGAADFLSIAEEEEKIVAAESKLILALPASWSDLSGYIKSHPDRCDSVAGVVFSQIQALVAQATPKSLASSSPRLALLVRAFQECQDVEEHQFEDNYSKLLSEWMVASTAEMVASRAEYETNEYRAIRNQIKSGKSREKIAKDFKRSVNDVERFKQMSLYVSGDDGVSSVNYDAPLDLAFYASRYLEHSDTKAWDENRTEIAAHVVLWKMLKAWIENDCRQSETDLFGSNQLQLMQGNSGKSPGRSKIGNEIKRLCVKYCQPRLLDPEVMFRQAYVKILFPSAPTPLFWDQKKPYFNIQAERRKEKNFTPPPVSSVSQWVCDECGNTYSPGYNGDDIVPNPSTFRPDDRIQLRRLDGEEMALKDALPKVALPETRYMCSCWKENAGVLVPHLITAEKKPPV